MMTPPPVVPAAPLDSPRRAALVRGAAFFALWIVLMQSAKPGDVAIGAFAASPRRGSAFACCRPQRDACASARCSR